MLLEINPACLHCPVAGAGVAKYEGALYAAAAAENDLESCEEAFVHKQSAFQKKQELEAAALPGEMVKEGAVVREIFGFDLPDERSIVASHNAIEKRRADAAQKIEKAQEAREAYDSLVSGCFGPKVISLAGFTVEQCQGRGVSFARRVILSPSKLL